MSEVANPSLHVGCDEFFLVAVAQNVSVQISSRFDDLRNVEATRLINHVHGQANNVLREFAVSEIDAQGMIELACVNSCRWPCWSYASKPITYWTA